MHASDRHQPPVISGRWVVAGMLALGIVFTAALWFYWHLHMAPFRPLQDALAAEFPDSAPRVEGGQRKMHEGTPRILRITMKVDFDPAMNTEKGESFLRRVAAFVHKQHDLAGYDRFALHLYHPIPEREIRQRTYARSVDELLDRAGPGAGQDDGGAGTKPVVSPD